MKTISLAILAAVALAFFAGAQQTQPSILNTPVQYNPINSYTTAATNATAVVTITGVTGQRVRIYSVITWCGGAPGSGMVPAVQITDAATLVFQTPGGMRTTADVYPVGKSQFLPGLTFSSGGTVVITGNPGGGCAQGTFMNVQADQF